jgi:hypothetical protein
MILELAFAASGHASDGDARSLLEALGSAQCETRLEAISRYSRSEDSEQRDNAALKKLSRTAPPPPREQATALLTDLENHKKGTARLLALVEILLAAREDHPEWTTEWAQSLETMLKSADGVLRVVGATTAALRRFPEGSDPVKADVVRPLIHGLRHESVSVRSAAHVGLRHIHDGPDSGICFNATDSADRRASAIQQWEKWWDANEERLTQERVEQRFW